MDIRDVALLLTAVGATAIVPKMTSALWRAITGRATRQRREIDRVRAEAAAADKRATAAEARADEQAYQRRITQEHASWLRRLLLEAPCVDPATIPPHPNYHRRKDDT
ncbi:hypothetical protein [Microbacterium sp. NPDC091662]|uniref:hypothetical protein n=1 Tax=Microbacterium sp. NPDC091662 TaxID=3364211 RepID=UPI0038220AAA